MTTNSKQTKQTGPSFAVFPTQRPGVMVVSHERSGTHFLMNSIAKSYGYVARPWIDLDHHQLPINYFHQPSLSNALDYLAEQRVAAIVKSHHPQTFFTDILDHILDRFVIFYIHRDPVDVMNSFWRFLWGWGWHEGPRCDDPMAFASTEPEGHLLRYQTHQRRNMLDRWAQHVEGWHGAAKGRPRLRIVAYKSLKDDYAATVSSFADILHHQPTDLTPPARDVNVVNGREPDRKLSPPDLAALRTLALNEVPATMKLLGYI